MDNGAYETEARFCTEHIGVNEEPSLKESEWAYLKRTENEQVATLKNVKAASFVRVQKTTTIRH